MSWATCYNSSNNVDYNSPPLMSDGRNWSAWQPDAVINSRIQTQEGITTNWAYRQYMQRNGLDIIRTDTLEACNALGLSVHFASSSTPSSNVPFTFRGTFDTAKPGFGYCNSDLKNPYLSREQLNARMIAPSVTLSAAKPLAGP